VRRPLLAAVVCVLVLGPGAAGRTGARADGNDLVEVVASLRLPSLARAPAPRTIASTARARLSIGSAASRTYLRTLAAEQQGVQRAIEAVIPAARVRWHKSIKIGQCRGPG